MTQPSRSIHHMRRGSWNDYTAYPISDVTLRAGLQNCAYTNHNLRNVDQVSITRRSRYYDDISTNPLRLDVDRLNDYTKNVNYCWTNPLTKDKHSQSRNEADAESITVIFLHGANRQEKHIYTSTSVKSLLRDYAEECGIQLPSLRFSVNGTTLFLSTLGRMTAKDINLSNHDEIIVTTSIQEYRSGTSTTPAKLAHHSSEGTKKSSRNKKTHKEQNRSKPTIIALDESDDKFKKAHSIELSKIFEEAETIFKAIRQKLNNLSLERTEPKTKLSSADRSKETYAISDDHNPNYMEQGGKAGKSSYTINVGQVENLYKSSKRKYFPTKCLNQRALCLSFHFY
eukprot:scaffold9865_cov58-Cyclotella_meneghiniana.AAC.4